MLILDRKYNGVKCHPLARGALCPCAGGEGKDADELGSLAGDDQVAQRGVEEPLAVVEGVVEAHDVVEQRAVLQHVVGVARLGVGVRLLDGLGQHRHEHGKLGVSFEHGVEEGEDARELAGRHDLLVVQEDLSAQLPVRLGEPLRLRLRPVAAEVLGVGALQQRRGEEDGGVVGGDVRGDLALLAHVEDERFGEAPACVWKADIRSTVK